MSLFNTYFTQFCPVCGRPVRVPVPMLAQPVTCQHCHAAFVAQDETAQKGSTNDAPLPLLLRAEALLASTE